MRALVISGGGNKIAFGVGAATELCRANKYNIYIGVSAGSVIALMSSTNKIDALHDKIKSFTLKDIFNTSPLTNGGKISIIAVLRILLNKNSLGKNNRFRKTMRSLFSEDDFKVLKSGQTNVLFGTTNFNTMDIEYPSVQTCNYEEVIDWVVASCTIPLVFEPFKINDSWYFDGGVVDYAGIIRALDAGATEVDVVLHTPYKKNEDTSWQPDNLISIAQRTIKIMTRMVEANDIIKAHLKATNIQAKINFYSPLDITNQAFYDFSSTNNETLYDMGRNSVLNGVNTFIES
jgi:predicted acylesterase/phospholipase RssA